MIVLEEVNKKFGGIAAIRNINLTLGKRETVVILGASGSGKSTLLRCINNLEQPTSGSVFIDGKKLTKRSRSKLCCKIGMVFQQFHLFPHMSVIENLTYSPRNVLNLSKTASEKKAQGLLEQFGVLEKALARPSELSGGQKQRVAIARALMMNPEVMLFDEPTSALDPEVIKEIIQIINNLKKDMTMVVITHHVKFAKVIADRIIFMDKGLILSDQTSEEFFTKPSSHRARLFLQNVGDLV